MSLTPPETHHSALQIGLIEGHFDSIDISGDGEVDTDEIRALVDKANEKNRLAAMSRQNSVMGRFGAKRSKSSDDNGSQL